MGKRRAKKEEAEFVEENVIGEDADPTFAESKGSEANQHAKKLVKEKELKEKIAKDVRKMFYSLKGDKVLQFIVKANGAYQVYIGNKKKFPDMYKAMVAKWKKEGLWVEPHLLEDTQHKYREECAALAAEKLKNKKAK